MKYSGDAESVEWFNMAFRKVDKSGGIQLACLLQQ